MLCRDLQGRPSKGIMLWNWGNVFSIEEQAIKNLLLVSEYWVGELAKFWRRADTWARSTAMVSRSSSCLAIICFISSIWSCFAARACSANSTFAFSCSTTTLSTLSSCKEELWLWDEHRIWLCLKWKVSSYSSCPWNSFHFWSSKELGLRQQWWLIFYFKD